MAGEVTGKEYTGGIAGWTNNRMEDCFVVGSVSGTNYTGGVVGYIEYGTALLCGTNTDASVHGWGNTGGFAGYCRKSNIEKCFAAGTVSGRRYTGGFAGYCYSTCYITQSFSTGNVTSTQDEIGGFIGALYYSYLGFVHLTQCFSTGAVNGRNRVGGLVGYSDSSSHRIRECYSAGEVTASSAAGGLVGSGNITITKSYWDMDASGMDSSAGGGTKLHTYQMKRQVSFVDWDYTSVWAIDEDVSYPFFQWYNIECMPDNTPPAISLIGSTVVDIECAIPFDDPGAAAFDNCNGDLSSFIQVTGSVNTDLAGDYELLYDVIDLSGNAAVTIMRVVSVTDNTLPILTVTGENPVTVECGNTYSDAGATAVDACDGNLIGAIVTVNPVDTGIPDTYTIVYTVSDAAANPVVEATRTVNVVDTTPPMLTRVGADPVTVECGDTYNEAGVIAADACDGDLSSSIITANPTNTGTPGSYTITYNISDSAANAASELTRTVNVVDTTAPVITLLGAVPQAVTVGESYEELGATANDICDGDLTAEISIDAGDVNTNVNGSYNVSYNVSDTAANAATETVRTVLVTGQPFVKQVAVEDSYNVLVTFSKTMSAGAADTANYTISDTGTLSEHPNSAAFVTGDTYRLTWICPELMHDGDDVTITVNGLVEDLDGIVMLPEGVTGTDVDGAIASAPIITLLGDNPTTAECGNSYSDAGATAEDACATDLTDSITIVNLVNVDLAGVYTVSYQMNDEGNNAAAEVIRTVNIIDTAAPVITLLGNGTVTTECDGSYSDAGATAFDSCDGNITSSIIVNDETVDLTVTGSYVITYNVSDMTANTAVEVTRTVNVVDTTVPLITLLGDAVTDIECSMDYTDAGAAADDLCDGNLTPSIVIVGNTIDTNTVGQNFVSYNVLDAAGNEAVEVIRTVNVIDTTVPVITLLGDAVVDVEGGTVYADAGATADDLCDGNLTPSIVIVGNTIDTNTVGQNIVSYNVLDTAGNEAIEVIRTVNVIDTTVPVITLLGDNPMPVECGSTFIDPGATATDNCNDDVLLTAAIQVTGTVNAAVPGSYSLTYTVLDDSNNMAQEIRAVTVSDTAPPELTVSGDLIVTAECSLAYSLGGTTAIDACEGNLGGVQTSLEPDQAGQTAWYWALDEAGTPLWSVGEPVRYDWNTPPTTAGDYLLLYLAVDTQGNTMPVLDGDGLPPIFDGMGDPNFMNGPDELAVDFARLIRVGDTTLPVLTLLGEQEVTLPCNTPYVEAGAEAADGCDGNLTGSIQTTGEVDNSLPGTYLLNYTVTDAAGNEGTAIRTVFVVSDAPPVITLLGDSDIRIEWGGSYVEPGWTAVDACNGDLTGDVVVEGIVDDGTLGVYILTYRVSDTSGENTSVSRTIRIEDSVSPVITLTGDNPMTVECSDTFTDPGAVAADNHDNGTQITAAIQITGNVNMAVKGSYTRTYNVNDTSGNAALPIQRTILVVDTTPPSIAVTGAVVAIAECGLEYLDAGAAAWDGCAGSLGAIQVTMELYETGLTAWYWALDESGVPLWNDTDPVTYAYDELVTNPGEYLLIYIAGDGEGNITPTLDADGLPPIFDGMGNPNFMNGPDDLAVDFARLVRVKDTLPPVVTLTGSSEVLVYCGETYTETGATAADVCDGDVTASLRISGNVNSFVTGTYPITYAADDSAGNEGTTTRLVHVSSANPPLLTLLGDLAIRVEWNGTYVEPGWTATDDCDGNLTDNVVVEGTVDTSTLGTYTLRYTVTSAAGNSISDTRTVRVEDSVIPEITLLGNTPMTVICGGVFTEPGATATDNHDGIITSQIQKTGTVNVRLPAFYTLYYSVTDSSGNEAVTTRTVEVTSDTIPTLTLVGTKVIESECGDEYDIPGAYAEDSCEGSLGAVQAALEHDQPGLTAWYWALDAAAVPLWSAGEPVRYAYDNLPNMTGNYLLVYVAVNSAGNTWPILDDTGIPPLFNAEGNPNFLDEQGELTINFARMVHISDTLSPFIMLDGETEITLDCNTTYEEAGMRAADYCEGNLTADIVITGNVDTSTAGVYTITYHVADQTGASGTAIRTVHVLEDLAPVITLAGGAETTVECGSSFEDPGATALDDCEGDLTHAIQIGGDRVDSSVPGVYEITYDVTDSFGNSAVQVIRTVTVVDKTRPIITLLGEAQMRIEYGSVFEDSGATAFDACDGDLTDRIGIQGDIVDTNIANTYSIHYSVTDNIGNKRTVIRQIIVLPPPVVRVPDIKDISIEEAREMLLTLLLYLEVEEEQYHTTIAAGHIISQTPLPESSVFSGSFITVVVSKGPEPGTEGENAEGEAIAEIAEMLIEQFENIDPDEDGRANLEDVQSILPEITEQQFNELDQDGDGYVNREELLAILEEDMAECSGCRACMGCCSEKVDTKMLHRMLGDWLLVGLSLVVLLTLTHKK
ncbi:MAG: DUF5011 domain-containing protein [Candidatus Hydrogenedentes bacterium]|nr:DUF5011 domain-containing protein [Candidatus Hydrogenedentota bacterium]